MIFSTFFLSLVTVFTLAVYAQDTSGISVTYKTNKTEGISIIVGVDASLDITITFGGPQPFPGDWFLHLVQASQGSEGTSDLSNTIALLQEDITELAKCSHDDIQCLVSKGFVSRVWDISIPIELEEGTAALSNAFFCIGKDGVCDLGTYSPAFGIVASGGPAVPIATQLPFTTGSLSLSITTSNPPTLVSIAESSAPSAAESESPRVTLVTATITSPSTTLTSTYLTTTGTSSSMTTTTTTPLITTNPASSTPSTTSAPAESSTPTLARGSKGLSTGAKAGIAVGVILLVLILLLVAFLLVRRRKQKQGMQPEQMMLAQGDHSREGSRDLAAEKGAVVGVGTVETTRGGIGAASEDTAYEEDRQRQQSPERDHEHEHEQSRAPLSSPETMSSATTSERFDEPYRDAPPAVYGDARHSPQIFSGSQHFLGEEGLSAEDIERLEEEERRIDAAIAESEARR